VTKKGEGADMPDKEGRYHHGNLRRALLDATLRLIDERGVEGLTLREVARQAGVSAAAPYHHFADKAALVEALTVEGYEALTAALHTAWAADNDLVERIAALGVAYVCFAVERPALFRLMFRPELRGPTGRAGPHQGDTPLARAASASYGVLVASITAAQEAGVIAPADPAPLALTAWATVHGLAVLLIDGPEKEMARSGDAVEQVASLVVRTLLHGILLHS